MTNVVTTPTGSGYNATQINTNIERLKNGINAETLHRRGGNNKMEQSLDMNGFTIYNIGVDPTNGSSVVTQDQFDDLVAQITAEVAANIGFVVDGDVIVGAGVTLGTAAFQDIQTPNYYSPGVFNTNEKVVTVNGSFGWGGELNKTNPYTGNLNSIDPSTGLSSTFIRYCTDAATNLPLDSQPGYVVNMVKDTAKSAQIFVSEAGEGSNASSYDLTSLALTSVSPTQSFSFWVEPKILWKPDGSGWLAINNDTTGTGHTMLVEFSITGDPFDVTGYFTKSVIDLDITILGAISGKQAQELEWSADGLELRIFFGTTSSGNQVQYVSKHALTVPYDLSTIDVGVVQSFTTDGTNNIKSYHTSLDGTTFLVFRSASGGSSAFSVYKYELTTPFDYTTYNLIDTKTTSNSVNSNTMIVSSDGLQLVSVHNPFGFNVQFRYWSMASAYDISTLVQDTGNTYLDSTNTNSTVCSLDPTGTYVLMSAVNGSTDIRNVKVLSMGAIQQLQPGIFYRTKDGNNWEEWKRLITNKDPANIKSTFTVGGEIDVPIVSGIATIDCSLGNSFNLVSTEDLTLTFVNAPEVGDDYTCKVKVTNGGSFLFILDSQIKVTGGVLPPLTASGVDIAVLTFNGTDIYGLISIPDAS